MVHVTQLIRFAKVLILLGLAVALTSCSTLRNPFFYEVSKENQRAYLLGTIHVGVPADDLPAHIVAKFDSAKRVGIEVDPYDVKMMNKLYKENSEEFDFVKKAAQDALARKEVSLPIDERGKPIRLSHRVSPSNWEYLKRIFVPYFKEPEVIEAFSPTVAFYLLITLAPMDNEIVPVVDKIAGVEDSMDLHFLERARNLKKDLTFLDGNKSFMSDECKDSLADQQIADWVKFRGKNMGDYMYSMRAAYRSGDEDRLLRELRFQLSSRLAKCLLSDRNVKWVNTIDRESREAAASRENPPFYAFGAGHLVGQNNLLELLRGRGFAVKRLRQ